MVVFLSVGPTVLFHSVHRYAASLQEAGPPTRFALESDPVPILRDYCHLELAVSVLHMLEQFGQAA